MNDSLYDIAVRRIDGSAATLGDYRGKVLLIVNVASECGLTPQYTALEKVYERYRDRGFELLGFPANDFGAQEPGTDAQISTFCTTNFGVEFPMFSKITVKGEGRHPLYDRLISAPGPSSGSEISWNFEKFLVDRHGNVVERFAPTVVPDDSALIAAIETRLQEFA